MFFTDLVAVAFWPTGWIAALARLESRVLFFSVGSGIVSLHF